MRQREAHAAVVELNPPSGLGREGAGLNEWKWETSPDQDLISRLRSLAVLGLSRMYRADQRLFVFRVRPSEQGIVAEGLSRRYTAIVLIGLAREEKQVVSFVLGGHGLDEVCARLIQEVSQLDNLGDVSLVSWAACATGHRQRRLALDRLVELRPAERPYPVVEVSWALTALCAHLEERTEGLRERLARRLIASFEERSGMFPHIVGGSLAGVRAHVTCFADLIYPIHALARYARLSGNREALDVALHCARQICRLQGDAGQWWWHYERRTGEVIEPYPVYSVHQDAMAPMALFALKDAAGIDFDREITKGLEWLDYAPELDGGSLIDLRAGLIWRKVARREPRKLSRSLQAAASRIHPSLRAPRLDAVFPPRVVDHEDRPYHLGWLLYAWPQARALQWARQGSDQ